jgi:hypothetical protein
MLASSGSAAFAPDDMFWAMIRKMYHSVRTGKTPLSDAENVTLVAEFRVSLGN